MKQKLFLSSLFLAICSITQAMGTPTTLEIDCTKKTDGKIILEAIKSPRVKTRGIDKISKVSFTDF